MYTNPFERKHSALRQALDRFIRGGGEAQLQIEEDLAEEQQQQLLHWINIYHGNTEIQREEMSDSVVN